MHIACCCGRRNRPSRWALLRAASRGGSAAAALARDFVALEPSLVLGHDFGWRTAFHRAAERGHVEVLEALAAALLEGGCGDDDGEGSGGEDGGGEERSGDQQQDHQQRRQRQRQHQQQLLRRAVDAADDTGLTPLMLACAYDRPGCAAALMRLGANPYLLDFLGRGALHYAAIVGSADCIGAVLGSAAAAAAAAARPATAPAAAARGGGGGGRGGSDRGGDLVDNSGSGGGWLIPAPNTPATPLVDARSVYGYTPLHYAAAHGRLEAARALASFGPDVGAQNTDVEPLISAGVGNTPLHLAAARGDAALARALLAVHVESMGAGVITGSAAAGRQWGERHQGASLWARVHAVTKSCPLASRVRSFPSRPLSDSLERPLRRHHRHLSNLNDPPPPETTTTNGNEQLQQTKTTTTSADVRTVRNRRGLMAYHIAAALARADGGGGGGADATRHHDLLE